MGPTFRKRRSRFVVALGTGERALLVDLCRQSRDLLASGEPSSDPAIARLFPAAYPEDPLRSLEFEQALGDAPRNAKIEAMDTLERTAGASELSEDELLAWMTAVNDLRLVLGTRIGITEESIQKDYPEDDPNHQVFGVYAYLTWLESEMLGALGEPDPTEPPGPVAGD